MEEARLVHSTDHQVEISSLLASSPHGRAALAVASADAVGRGGAVYQLVFVHHPIGFYAVGGLASVEDESSLHAHSPATAGYCLFGSDWCPISARRDPILGGCMAEEVPLAIASLQGFTIEFPWIEEALIEVGDDVGLAREA